MHFVICLHFFFLSYMMTAPYLFEETSFSDSGLSLRLSLPSDTTNAAQNEPGEKCDKQQQSTHKRRFLPGQWKPRGQHGRIRERWRAGHGGVSSG